jgi:hypothetical protein
MNKIMGALLISILLLFNTQSQGATVSNIIGLVGECDTNNSGCNPIPLVISSLCTASCERNTRPSYTDVNRMWGGTSSCRTSVNGGSTWGNCTTQPFSSGAKEDYAGTANGSVVGGGAVGADCLIKKSTDNGSIWVTKYTGVGVGETCGGGTTGPTRMSCFADGSCTYAYKSPGDLAKVIRSTDNGENWSLVFTGVTSTRLIQAGSYTNPNGTVSQAEGAGWRNFSGSSGSYANSVAWAAGSSCWGAFILSGTAYGVCYSGAGSIYEIRNSLTGTVVFSPSLPGAQPFATQGGLALGYGSNIVYMLAGWVPLSGQVPIGVYVSRDSGATFTLIGLSNIAANSMREGDFWQHPTNGCLYFSAGTIPQFIKICN